MRIALIQDFIVPYFSGGSSVYVSDIARGLREMGHDVDIYTVKNLKSTLAVFSDFNKIGVRIIEIDTKLSNIPVYSKKIRRLSRIWSVLMFFFNPFVYKQLVRELKRTKPDIIHIHDSLYLSLSVFRAAYRSKVPVVFTCHFTHLFAPQGLTRYNTKGQPRLTLFNRLVPILSKIVVGSPTAVLYLSSFGQRLYRTFGFFPRSIQTVFPTYSRFTNTEVNSKKSNETFNLLYSGRLDAEKGLRTLLEACQQIQRSIRLTICGEGKDRVSLEKEFGNDGRILFLGFLDTKQLERQFQTADVVILPSTIYEMFPLSAVEGISFGKPVIATSIGGTLDIIRHENNGLLFPPGNSNALASEITKLSTDPTLYAKLARQARHDASKYSRQNHLKALLSYYQRLITSNTLFSNSL